MRGAMLASQVDVKPQRPTVLLVEDEVLIRLLVADELRSQGINVLEASNADEALIILESSLPVHVLFTDIRMPGRMDGIGLTKLARGRRPDIKVIIASSHLPPGYVRDSVDAFIFKPYDLAAIAQQVEKMLVESGNAPADQ
jgi:two-component system, response regulator PdtaR